MVGSVEVKAAARRGEGEPADQLLLKQGSAMWGCRQTGIGCRTGAGSLRPKGRPGTRGSVNRTGGQTGVFGGDAPRRTGAKR